MRLPEEERLLGYLKNRSEQIAEAWYDAISDVGFVVLPAAEVRQRLDGLTGRILELVSTESPDRQEMREVGSALAEMRMLEPETLGKTLKVLCSEFVEGLPTEEAILLQRRLAELLPEIAVGFTEQARQTVLREQESIRKALIRDRERVEKALRQSEAGLAEAQRIAQLGHWELDIIRDELRWSEEIFRIFGMDREEFGARLDAFRSYVHPDDLEMVDRLGQAAIRGEPADFEHRIIRPDGGVRHVHQRVESALSEGGQPVKLVGTVQDVTARKQMEEELRESRERFQTIFDQAPIGISIADPERRLLETNPAYQELTGYTEEELFGKPIAELSHPQDVLDDEDLNQEVSSGTLNSYRREKRYVRRDGEEIWVQPMVAPVRDTGGEVRFLIGLVENITERKRAETELKESEERLRALADAAFEGIVITYEGEILEVNRALADMLGYEPREMFGHSLLDFIVPEHRGRARERVASGSREVYEVTGLRKDGARIQLEVRGRNLYYRGQDVRVSAVRDISARKKIEEDLREYNRRLEELAVMKADLSAMAAHELGSPLAAVRGLVEMLETGDHAAEEQKRLLSAIDSEAEKLFRLVSDVREAAAAEREDFEVRPEAVAVSELLEDATVFAENLPGGGWLEVESAVTGEVWADRNRIVQVLRNLISNAVKYSPGREPIILRVLDGENSVRFEVIDRGSGISPEDATRIFEKFGRGRDASGRRMSGLGLGLYISRRIVRAHGGELTLHPTPGEGSSFGFDLPKAP